MSFENAAAVPEAFLTAYDALVLRARLTAGEAVLLHAAGSGVGTAAVAIAGAAGARVIALSRSAEKRSRLASMDVHKVLDPAARDIAQAITMAAGGAGVAVAIDFLGAASFALNVEVLAPQGRLVLLGTLSGAKIEVDLGALMRKRLTVIGSVLRSRPIEEKIELVQSFSRTMLPLLAAGRMQPFVDRVLPFEDAAAAYAIMERNENFGKIVLRRS
jgi:NADPH:quinone reductase-like Zn-dependent oxidoreductase